MGLKHGTHPYDITLYSNYNCILEKYIGTRGNAYPIIVYKLLGYKIIYKALYYAQKKVLK